MALPPITRVSTANDGGQLSDDSGISSVGINDAGDRVVFNSMAPEAAAPFPIEFPSAVQPSYVKDLDTGRLTLADGGALSLNGQAAIFPRISADGSTVLYAQSGAGVIFARDVPGVTSEQVTRNPDGSAVAVDGSTILNASAFGVDLSADGRQVVYNVELDTGNFGGSREVYYYDRATGEVTRADTASDGSGHDKLSQESAISPDGRYVVFSTYSDALSPLDSNGEDFDFGGFDLPNAGTPDIYRKDMVTGETVLVSLRSDGSQFSKSSFDPEVSANGRYVAFENTAAEASDFRILVRDMQTGETHIASSTADGVVSDGTTLADPTRPGAGDSVDPEISSDGRFVLFWSVSDLLAEDDKPNAYDLFVKDMQTGALARVGHAAQPEDGRVPSHGPADISDNGQWIVFSSEADDLVANDTNGARDVFVVRNPLLEGEANEATSAQDLVTQFYIGYFDRAPDPLGLDFWVDSLKDGFSPLEMAESFSVQTETTALYPFLANGGEGDPSNFITQVYNNLFERDPEPAGLDFWVSQIQNGKPVGRAIIDIISGAQGQDAAVMENKVNLGSYYAEQFQSTGETWDAETDRAEARGVMDGIDATAASLQSGLDAVDDLVATIGTANPIQAGDVLVA